MLVSDGPTMSSHPLGWLRATVLLCRMTHGAQFDHFLKRGYGPLWGDVIKVL
jgi:hypothetical protein